MYRKTLTSLLWNRLNALLIFDIFILSPNPLLTQGRIICPVWSYMTQLGDFLKDTQETNQKSMSLPCAGLMYWFPDHVCLVYLLLFNTGSVDNPWKVSYLYSSLTNTEKSKCLRCELPNGGCYIKAVVIDFKYTICYRAINSSPVQWLRMIQRCSPSSTAQCPARIWCQARQRQSSSNAAPPTFYSHICPCKARAKSQGLNKGYCWPQWMFGFAQRHLLSL